MCMCVCLSVRACGEGMYQGSLRTDENEYLGVESRKMSTCGNVYVIQRGGSRWVLAEMN